MKNLFIVLTMFVLSLFVASVAFSEVFWIDKNQSGTIGSPTKPIRKGYIGSLTPLVFEGAITNDYQSTIAVTEPTADRTFTLPDSSGTFMLTGDMDTVNSVWFGTNALLFEGATADAFEFTLQPLNDPVADITVKVPSLTLGNVMISTLITNDVDVANSVWCASNGLTYEGSTADAFETTITVVDPTGDRVITMPNVTGTVVTTGDTGSVSTGMIAASAVTEVKLSPSSGFGLGVLRTARAQYSFAADGGAVGLITPATNATIPDNAVIVACTINSTTAALSSGAATISIGTSAGSGAASLLAATGKASFSLDALLNGVPVFATPVKLTAAGLITCTVGAVNLTAGVIEITCLYFVAAN